ncbi:type VII secretion integral membrane protein EccD [Dactylosporangium vinaceum]|uniref:Type VII secretion integral membrane protein EccD n=1 Tax=Dactylosporangium vinaceum TaxID=53362 RepID=A0ABV5MJY6_9ACTN|nr:type VII secretion integral membrane protein EccD [Dactylosporangium vinaceum]UAB92722.1 type VII secretion integral membrane protein EccD [Dactylosporangium vinaceum]
MPTVAGGGLSKVTIVAPQSRVDLALPADVPLADLLPTLLRYARPDLADEGVSNGGWVLSRLGSLPLDSSRTSAQLEIRDGELLYFTPRAQAAPEVVFDDVVDAVATGTQERGSRWQPANARRFALGLGVCALLAGALVALAAGPPQLPGALVGLVVGAALVLTGMITSRALADSRSGVAFGLVGIVYGGIGGLLVLAGDRSLTHLSAANVLIGGAAVAVFASIAAVAVADATPVFLAAAAAGVAICIGAAIDLVFGGSPAAGAAVVFALAFALLPATPMLSYRMARLPIPTVPTDPEELRADATTVDGQRVLERSRRADEFLTAMLGWVAAVGLGAAVVLAVSHAVPDLILCAVLALLLLIRARWFLGLRQRLPLLIAGSAALGAVALAGFLATSAMQRLTLVLGTLIVLAIISVGFGLAGAGRRISPVWARVLDILETTLIVSVVPLVLWVCNLYAWVRSLKA